MEKNRVTVIANVGTGIVPRYVGFKVEQETLDSAGGDLGVITNRITPKSKKRVVKGTYALGDMTEVEPGVWVRTAFLRQYHEWVEFYDTVVFSGVEFPTEDFERICSSRGTGTGSTTIVYTDSKGASHERTVNVDSEDWLYYQIETKVRQYDHGKRIGVGLRIDPRLDKYRNHDPRHTNVVYMSADESIEIRRAQHLKNYGV